MFGMDALDVMLLVAASYVAVLTLVRLMQRRRDGVIDNLSQEVELEKQRLKKERKKQRLQEMRERAAQQHAERMKKRAERRLQESDQDAA